MLEILHEDNHLLVVVKPSGILVQGDHTGDPTVLDHAKAYLKEKYRKPGNVYLGLVHRLDRPASGVIVLARTSKAASRLSELVRSRSFKKTYHALIEGHPPRQGEWTDLLIREDQHSRVAKKEESGKEARLAYTVLDHEQSATLVKIKLITGRHHQIRVQFASRGYPLLGDFRYGSKKTFGERAVALHASRVDFEHPTLKTPIICESAPTWKLSREQRF